MTESIDPITRKKLVLVKQLFQLATVQSERQSAVGRLLAVVEFDLAIETMVKTVVGSLDSSKQPPDNFSGLIQQCESLLSKAGYGALPDKANIGHVHILRNDAQHKARYPNASDINDCRVYIRDFLRKIVSQVWNLDFDQISLIDLVSNDEVKEFLLKSEKALSQGEYGEAVLNAGAGLTLALSFVEEELIGRFPPFAGGILLIDTFGKPMSESEYRSAFEATKRMRETLLISALGLEYYDYKKYIEIAGHIGFMGDRRPVAMRGDRTISAEDAEYVTAYCINAVIQIEDQYGEI